MVVDNPDAVASCAQELNKGGYEARVEAVRTADEFRARLSTQSFQVVIANDTLSLWSGREALVSKR